MIWSTVLFWVAEIARGSVLKSPAFHGSSKTTNTGSEAIVHCLRGRSSPSSSPGSSTNLCSLEWSAACHSSDHLRESHIPLETSAGVDPGAGGHAPRKTVVTLGGRVVGSLWGGGEGPHFGGSEQCKDRGLSPQERCRRGSEVGLSAWHVDSRRPYAGRC